MLVLLAGPYMVANDAILASGEKRIGAVGLAGIVVVCGVWLFAAGVLILGAVSEFSVLSAAAARVIGSPLSLSCGSRKAIFGSSSVARMTKEGTDADLFARRDFP